MSYHLAYVSLRQAPPSIGPRTRGEELRYMRCALNLSIRGVAHHLAFFFLHEPPSIEVQLGRIERNLDPCPDQLLKLAAIIYQNNGSPTFEPINLILK